MTERRAKVAVRKTPTRSTIDSVYSRIAQIQSQSTSDKENVEWLIVRRGQSRGLKQFLGNLRKFLRRRRAWMSPTIERFLQTLEKSNATNKYRADNRLLTMRGRSNSGTNSLKAPSISAALILSSEQFSFGRRTSRNTALREGYQGRGLENSRPCLVKCFAAKSITRSMKNRRF